MSEPRITARKLFLFPIATLFCVCAAILIVVSVFPPREHYSSANVCINNLRNIDLVKNEWALINKKTTNDTPTWEDIKPYIQHDKPYFKFDSKSSLPMCPLGGMYRIGKMGEPPTCSLGSNVTPAHILP
jgi:hypothetical protein